MPLTQYQNTCLTDEAHRECGRKLALTQMFGGVYKCASSAVGKGAFVHAALYVLVLLAWLGRALQRCDEQQVRVLLAASTAGENSPLRARSHPLDAAEDPPCTDSPPVSVVVCRLEGSELERKAYHKDILRPLTREPGIWVIPLEEARAV